MQKSLASPWINLCADNNNIIDNNNDINNENNDENSPNSRFVSVSMASDFQCPIDANIFRFHQYSIYGRSPNDDIGFYNSSASSGSSITTSISSTVSTAQKYGGSLRFLFDDRLSSINQARTSIGRTLFLLLCLIFIGRLVVRDQRSAVVKPIEHISNILNRYYIMTSIRKHSHF